MTFEQQQVVIKRIDKNDEQYAKWNEQHMETLGDWLKWIHIDANKS